MFNGEQLTEDKASIIYSNETSYGPFIRTEINGKRIGGTTFTPKRALLTPGVHQLELGVYITPRMLPPGDMLATGEPFPSGFMYLRRYKFDIPMKPGYSYMAEHPGWHLDSQKFVMCVYGEPHNAEGSKVAWTKEERLMSDTAEKIVCAQPDLIVTHDSRIERPDSPPGYLDYSGAKNPLLP